MKSTSQAPETVDQRPLSQKLIAAASTIGRSYGVSGEIHPDDHIFWYACDEQYRLHKSETPDFYFSSGRGTAEFLRDLLAEPCLQSQLAERPRPNDALSILEFASGYGRVTRFFPQVLPAAQVVACDIHPDAVAFLRGIGLDAVLSSAVPEKLTTGRTFDVVFALSFFTHMPRSTWTRWLTSLANQLVPGGLLIFTTHGKVSQGLMGAKELEPDGFYFTPASEQKDLPVHEYGNTVTTFEYVYSQLARTGLTLLQYKQAGIAHHDVYVLRRGDASGQTPITPDPGNQYPGEEVMKLRAEVAALRRSTSWRMTAPARALVDALRRLR
jgi:phospholipid N-methyltransferase